MTLDEARTTAIFLPYQIKWINDKSPLKIWEKSRRIGASWCEAFVCAVLASLAKNSGGMDCFYMAYEKEVMYHHQRWWLVNRSKRFCLA